MTSSGAPSVLDGSIGGAPDIRSTRAWVWLQLLIGWLPVWALYVTLIATAHPGTGMLNAVFSGLRAISAAAVLGLVVRRLTLRVAWPHPFRVPFLGIHLVAALLFAVSWVGAVAGMESLLAHRLVLVAPNGVMPFVILGVWLYVMVAGVSYATQATQRAALAEAMSARSQLAALRSQLQPHFLFNALHTVVQLIPQQPRAAAQAAEQIAALLRMTLEDDRDVITLAEELDFVDKYLDLERIRFGDRLRIRVDVPSDVRDASVPSFVLQTLVENAVRHGAMPKVEATDIHIAAIRRDDRLTLTVTDTGVGAPSDTAREGTGLRRLEERLRVLYGGAAHLTASTNNGGGFTAAVEVPFQHRELHD
ncbi:MAG: histidine kinase [Gemmatimonadaceae bacterium]